MSGVSGRGYWSSTRPEALVSDDVQHRQISWAAGRDRPGKTHFTRTKHGKPFERKIGAPRLNPARFCPGRIIVLDLIEMEETRNSSGG